RRAGGAGFQFAADDCGFGACLNRADRRRVGHEVDETISRDFARQPDYPVAGSDRQGMNRRQFIGAAGTLAAAGILGRSLPLVAAEKKEGSASHLPRWRGFNLTEKV